MSTSINDLNLTKKTPLKSTNKEKEKEIQNSEINTKMFYSQCLLSSKSDLSNIWIAGYFYKRLKKCQISDTNIPNSVDKILLEGLPAVTYRVLGYLLLGVVRIHSKKAELLYEDCDQFVSDINRLSLSKKPVRFRDIVRSAYTISLPERYELDTFQLEITDGGNRDHVSRKEDIILKDVGKDIHDQYSLGNVVSLNFIQDRFEDGPFQCEELDDAQASSGMSAHLDASSSMQTPEKPATDKETSPLGHTPADNVLSPNRMEIDVEVHSPNRMENVESNKEKLREMRLSQDAKLDIDMVFEPDNELQNPIDDYDMQNIAAEDKDVQDKSPLKNHDQVMEENNEALSTVGKTSGSEVAADLAAGTTPQFAAAPTPFKKENSRRPNKRKCIFDETTRLNNELMKQSIEDASDLVCKRNRAPHKAIDIWRVNRIPVLLKKFSEPLLPCVALELTDVQSGKITETQPSLDVPAEPVETTQNSPKLEVVVSPRTPGDSRPTIAPGTPVRCSTSSARVFSADRAADSDGDGAHSYDNVIKDFGLEEEDIGPKLMMDEMEADEGDSQEPHKSKDGWSTRTRTVAKYLHAVSQTKKQQGEETVKLLPIVKRKTKGESARLFFEILVLSTGGFMKVKQPKPYEDVLLQETAKMEATLQHSS